ncbi:hypothetical protein [Algoriphagus antarcticus]|uniref:SPOR domain-containing protein n=1 Tax=Algoriphagus antarcticus TaxID=238540 RepID=A0A3E0DX02_9BACT|nr:hypothetical protein [Algoriphagus antarcticus]REG90584.1 hypothetical protein C8N25_10682 [Algoriphagus antarcticus]
MSENDLEFKKFELDQKIKFEEIEIRKKELDLKLKEQRKISAATIPLILGILTIGYSAFSLFHQNKSNIELEDKKFISSLIAKAIEEKTYLEFSEKIEALNYLGIISIDSNKLAKLKKARFVSEEISIGEVDSSLFNMTKDFGGEEGMVKIFPNYGSKINLPFKESSEPIKWMIVAGGDKNLDGAQFEFGKAKKTGFNKVDIWLKENSYRTVIGSYNSYQSAVEDLFIVRESINKTAYIVRSNSWCKDFEVDSVRKIKICT